MKKTFLFLAALAMSAVSMAATATYTKVTSDPTDWSGDYILVYEADGAARVFTGVDAANDFVEATISDNTIEGEFVTLTLETTDGGYFVKVNGGDNDGKYFSSNSNANDLKFADAGAVMSLSYDADNETTMMVTPAGCVMRYNKSSGQNRFRFYKSTSYTSQQPVQLYKVNDTPPTPQKEVVDVRVTDEPTKMEYFVGESFDPAGLTVTAIYDDASTEDVTSKATWTIEPATFTEASESASVSVKAEFNKVKSKSRTITGIVVTVKEVTYANTYTSNVELTTDGGTSATAAKVVIGGTEYDAIKAGTGKVQGACVVTIPAATKMLHFHAAAWNGESVTLDVNGTEYALVADAGVSNNSPFTLQNDPETQDYFTFDPKGATTITFAVTAGFRFVLFGVNAELEEGTLAAPSFEPTETDFDQKVMVTLTAEEGASIFYALDEDVTSMNAIEYSVPIELEATTTVYAVAKKDGKESAHVSKTYTLIPAYTVTEMAAITPANQKFVLVLDNEAIVDIYTGKSGDVSGIYFQVGDKKIELYNQDYAFPKEWKVGGTVSGRVMGVWTDYNGQWELKIDATEIEKLTYTEPSPTNINNVKANAKATKAIVNGQIMIVRDNKVYNVMGAEL